MAGPVLQAPAALAAVMAALQGAGLATQADVAAAVAPLATKADGAAAVAPLAAQIAALQLQVDGLAAQIAALPAQIQASIVAALAPLNAPAVAAAAAATVQAISAARARNAHDRDGVPYVAVPLADGTLPPTWPAAGLDRAALAGGAGGASVADVSALLTAYGLPLPAGARARRNALAEHLGAPRV
jgi:hypothetical protein